MVSVGRFEQERQVVKLLIDPVVVSNEEVNIRTWGR
jgi:hypothetical protein